MVARNVSMFLTWVNMADTVRTPQRLFEIGHSFKANLHEEHDVR